MPLMATDLNEMDRYLVISSDTHAGPEPRGYGPYLEKKWRTDFDDWLTDSEKIAEVVRKVMGPKSIAIDGDPEIDAGRNFDSDHRLKECEADGIVAEVIFPNTAPPFSPRLFGELGEPGVGHDHEKRWAGIRAHNRWLADFCSEAPNRRAGLVQIFLPNIEGSIEEIRWAKEAGLTGGVLVPGAPPGSGIAPLYAPEYEPIWAVCDELDIVLNHHSGGSTPDYGPYLPEALTIFMLEVTWFAHRALWHLMFSGVFERHPELQFVMTETGTGWAPGTLRELDSYYNSMKHEVHSSEHKFGGPAVEKLSLKPSEYFERQCHIGASFLQPTECDLRHEIGVQKIMWGSDYPHTEGCYPYSRELMRTTFEGVDTEEIQQMLGTNAAAVYGFDIEKLAAIAARVGPTKAEIAVPLDYSDVPDEARKCPGFSPHNQRSGEVQA
jgi:predicted TIM-barrel fold metal-dependent hydrolase